MQRKETILVIVGAFLLTNLSILATLFVTGHFDQGDKQQKEEPAEKTPAKDDATSEEQAAEVVEPPPSKPKIRSMGEAMYLCEDRLMADYSTKRISYQFDTVASYFSSDTGNYLAVIQVHTPSRLGAPQENLEVTCEVSAIEGNIVNFRSGTLKAYIEKTEE